MVGTRDVKIILSEPFLLIKWLLGKILVTLIKTNYKISKICLQKNVKGPDLTTDQKKRPGQRLFQTQKTYSTELEFRYFDDRPVAP